MLMGNIVLRGVLFLDECVFNFMWMIFESNVSFLLIILCILFELLSEFFIEIYEIIFK